MVHEDFLAAISKVYDIKTLCEYIVKDRYEGTTEKDEQEIRATLARYGYDLSEDGYYEIVGGEE